MRTLILDQDGNAIITCNEQYDTINIMSGEYISRHGVRPAMKFSVGSIEAIEAIRDFLNSVCAKNAQVAKLTQDLEKLKVTHLESPTEETSKKLKALNKKLSNLKGNSVSNGRKRII